MTTRRNTGVPAYAVAIRRLRDECGLSHAALALPLKVSAATVSRWEGGSRKPSGSNFSALKTFALKRGLDRFAAAFEVELQRVRRDEADRKFLQIQLKRAKAGEGYAKRLLEASKRPVRDYAEEKAAAYFDAFLESPKTWLKPEVRSYPSVRLLGDPPPALPARADERAPNMRAAVSREIWAVDVLRRAQKLEKPKHYVLWQTVLQGGLDRRWKAFEAETRRRRGILEEALAKAKEGKPVDVTDLLAQIASLLPQRAAAGLGEGISHLEALKRETVELLENAAERIREIYNWACASNKLGQPSDEKAFSNFLESTKPELIEELLARVAKSKGKGRRRNEKTTLS